MTEITIIYPATVDWYLLYQRPQQMLMAFSDLPGVRCIFVSSESYKKLPAPITYIKNDMYVVNQRASYEHLIKGKKVYWFSYPPHHTYGDTIRPDFTVFDALDNPADEFKHWANQVPTAVEKSDMIVATADILYDYHKNSGKPLLLLPNAADYEHFAKASTRDLPKPADFPVTDKPVIGFYGAMASWVDFELFEKMARNYHVVLIGNNKWYQKHSNNFNITSLEHKDYSELPNYLAHFDVAAIPFKLTEMIKGCDPIKYYEYLAAGKPIVATEMIELKKYSDVTYFINHDNYEEVIAKALAENNPEKVAERMAVAQEHSWNARAEKAIQKIRELI